jgi:DHA2 family methylenomycin A resistance protein-like MFS transporter
VSDRPRKQTKAITAYLAISASLVSFSSLEFMLVEIQSDFSMSPDETIVVAQIASAACLMAVFLAGALSDRLGTRRMLVGSSLLFGVGSACVGLALNITMLVIGLSIAGVGTIVMSIVGLAVINATFVETAQRARAFGVFALVAPVVSILVPFVASAIIPISSWRWVTGLWITIAGVTAVASSRSLRSDERSFLALRSELLTPALAGIALSAIALAFSFISVSGQVAERLHHGLLSAGIGLAAMVALVIAMRRLEDPTLDLRSLRTPGSFPILTALFVVNGVNLFFFTYLLLQYRYHQTLFQTAVSLVLPQVAASIGAVVSGHLSATLGPRRVATTSLVLAAIGSTGAFALGPESSVWLPVIVLSIAAIPIAASVGPMTQLFMDRAPANGTGAASSIRNASVNLGIAIAGLITGTIVFDELDRDTERTIEAYTQQADAFHIAGALCVLAYLIAAVLVQFHARRRVAVVVS